MAARGIRFHGNGAYAVHTLDGTPLDYGGSGDFSICGWMNIRADQASGDARNCPFYLGDGSFHGIWFSSGDEGEPWDMEAVSVNGNDPISSQLIVSNVPNDADYFWAAAYDHTTGLWTFYVAADGAGGLTSIEAVGSSWSNNPTQIMLAAAGNGSTKSLDGDVTCVKAWTRKLSAVQLLAEMKSPTVVDATNLYDFWALEDEEDLEGSEGGLFVLTGAVTPGIEAGAMDPVDLQVGDRKSVV